MLKDDGKFMGFEVTVNITLIWIILPSNGLNMYPYDLKKTAAVCSQYLIILCHNAQTQVKKFN